MGATPANVPSALRWYYWLTALRTLLMVAVLVGVYIAPHLYLWKITYEKKEILLAIPLFLWLINDILLLTFDVKRTGWYLGTVGAQAALFLPSLGTVFIFMCFFGLPAIWEWFIFVSWVLYMYCTLHQGIHLLVSKRRAGKQACWGSNVKEMLIGTSSNQDQASFFGRPRNPSLGAGDLSGVPYFFTVYVPTVLFRRNTH